MLGKVSAEKERFERLASEMKNKEKDLAIKSHKLLQVEEIIKNSPCPIPRPRNPLKDKNDASFSCDEVRVVCMLRNSGFHINFVHATHNFIFICFSSCLYIDFKKHTVYIRIKAGY